MFKCEFCGKEFPNEKELNNHLKKEHKSELFIKKSKLKHGNKFTYEKTKYVDKFTKVIITCPIHGDFEQNPYKHLKGQGCPKCAHDKRRKTTNEFIEDSIKIHGKKYNYSKSNYINAHTNVVITCPIHGDFEQTPNTHLSGCGCPKCGSVYRRNNDDFIEESKIIHNNYYIYSKTQYKNNKSEVTITCPIHGDFEQKPEKHLSGHGCPQCKKSKLETNIYNLLTKLKINYIYDKCLFDWLKDKNKLRIDFYLNDYNIGIECQGIQHFKVLDNSIFKKYENIESIQNRDYLKYQLCKEHGIEIVYYFPENFLNYNTEFYKDKICFHNIQDLQNYLIRNVKNSKN